MALILFFMFHCYSWSVCVGLFMCNFDITFDRVFGWNLMYVLFTVLAFSIIIK